MKRLLLFCFIGIYATESNSYFSGIWQAGADKLKHYQSQRDSRRIAGKKFIEKSNAEKAERNKRWTSGWNRFTDKLKSLIPEPVVKLAKKIGELETDESVSISKALKRVRESEQVLSSTIDNFNKSVLNEHKQNKNDLEVLKKSIEDKERMNKMLLEGKTLGTTDGKSIVTPEMMKDYFSKGFTPAQAAKVLNRNLESLEWGPESIVTPEMVKDYFSKGFTPAQAAKVLNRNLESLKGGLKSFGIHNPQQFYFNGIKRVPNPQNPFDKDLREKNMLADKSELEEIKRNRKVIAHNLKNIQKHLATIEDPRKHTEEKDKYKPDVLKVEDDKLRHRQVQLENDIRNREKYNNFYDSLSDHGVKAIEDYIRNADSKKLESPLEGVFDNSQIQDVLKVDKQGFFKYDTERLYEPHLRVVEPNSGQYPASENLFNKIQEDRQKYDKAMDEAMYTVFDRYK